MNVVVVGASGGIGSAMTARLAASPRVARILACSRSPGTASHPKIRQLAIDLEDEASIAKVAQAAIESDGNVDLVVVAAGLLHDGDALRPEKSWRALDATSLARLYRVNTIGPALLAKHFLPLLRSDHKSVFAALSARVGSISDNKLGGWHAYRASKAALNMLVKTFSIELARRNQRALCVALHPGSVATPLSRPFQANIPEGKLFTPDFAAARLLDVIDRLESKDTGNLFAWNGERIPG